MIKQLPGQGGDLSNDKLFQLLKKCPIPALQSDLGRLLKCLLKKTTIKHGCGKAFNTEER